MTLDFMRRVHADLLNAALSYPGGAIKGSQVGVLLRTRGIVPAEHGFPRVRDLMDAMEAQGLVKTGSDGKLAYTVWPIASASGLQNMIGQSARPAAPISADDDSIVLGHRFLRQAVYDICVNEGLPHPRRIGASTGSVWVGTVPNSDPAETNWVEIPPIPADTQKAWARVFLIQKGWGEASDLFKSLEADDWFRSFPAALETRFGAGARAMWNRRRTAKVVKEVEKWAGEKKFPLHLLFEGEPLSGASLSDPLDERRRILALIRRLPLSVLRRVQIPIGEVARLMSDTSPVHEEPNAKI